MTTAWYLVVGIGASLAVFGFVIVMMRLQDRKLSKHYAMASLQLRKLPTTSRTRRRMQAAQAMFAKGWKVLGSKDPSSCLEFFAKAVEIDEMGCRWKQQFETKLEKIGDFFELPPKDDRDKYHSMLAEAYLVVLLYTVLSVYGKQDKDLEEDFRVVKTRLDVCVSLQPKNPAVFKLRADMLQKFGHLANRAELISDLREAIKLAEADVEGTTLQCEGMEPKEQRDFLLAFCHHQLANLLHRNKDMDGAFAAYTKSAQYATADPYFVEIPDTQFNLCILTLMRSRNVQTVDKPGILLKATEHYKAGVEGEKRLLKYLPATTSQVSRQLAKELIKKFAKSKTS